MSQPSEREIEVFNVALELPAGERVAYLDTACAGDPVLRQRIEELLKASEESCGCLEEPAAVAPGAGGAGRPPLIPAEKPGDRIGRYKLLQQIGEGGCGVVYMAEQQEPVHRRVALKVIKLGMDTKNVIARFEAERQALALMDHPNIARVLDAGATNTGRPYFVMELVRGIKITDYCDQNNLSTRDRLALFVQVCRAIQHAHQKGIIHRDIKPSNILVTMDDRAPVPKVIDFGIAKATQGKLTDQTLFTAFEQFIGTPAYMSPEQAEMRTLDIDTRSDIYSLGVLLYELLTGQTPFDAQKLLQAGLDEIRRTIREQEPARPSTRLNTMMASELTLTASHRRVEPPKLIHLVRGDLDWIVMKALEKDRTRRYDTAIGFARDVERYLADEPVLACPPSNLYKFQKLVRRNKLVFVAVSAVTVALIIGLGVSIWMFVQEKKAQQQTMAAEREQSRLLEAAKQSQLVEAQQRREAEAARAEEARQRGIASEQEMLARRRFYDAQMNLANQAWGLGELARTADLLEAQQPEPGEPDLRSFEWYYLWGLCNQHLLRTIRVNTDTVPGVALSPDGTTAASIDGVRSISLWDTASGAKRRLQVADSSGGLGSVVFSPDGKMLASGGYDNLVQLWDVASGQLLKTLGRQSNTARCLAFSPDGKILASGGDPGPDGIVVTLSDIIADRPLGVMRGNKSTVMDLAFSPDGLTLAVGSSWGDDGGACFIRSLTNSAYPSATNLGRADALSFSPDRKTLALATWDGIHLYDVATWKPLGMLKGHIGVISGLSFLPDSHSVVSCGTDRTVRIWRWPAQDPDDPIGQVIGAHLDAALCLAVSRDGSRVITGGNDGTIKLWNVAAHNDGEDSIVDFKFGDDGDYWHGLWSVLPLPDHKRVLVITQDGGELRDMVTGHKLASWPGATGRGALSPDGKFLATGYKDGVLKLWEVATEKLVASVKTEFYSPFLAFSPDGRTLASSGAPAGSSTATPIIRLWDATDGLKAIRTMDSGYGFVGSMGFSPDGKTLAVAPGPGIRLFDTSTYQTMGELKTPDYGSVSSIVFSPDSKMLATGRNAGVVCLWDAQTGQLLNELKGHASTVWSLAFSPDGRTLASGSEDSTVRLWDVQTGQERVVLTSPNSQLTVKSVAFADASTLIIGFEDGWVSIRRAVHNLKADVASATVEESPDDIYGMLELATRQAWFGRDADYEVTRHRLMQQTAATNSAPEADRAAKAACLRPSTDAALLTKALSLAQRAVELGKNDPLLQWYELGLGLAEYRNGQYAAAEQTLTIAEQMSGNVRVILGTARLFHAMVLDRQNKPVEARKLFSQAEALMPPLPKDESRPFVDGRLATLDDLIFWLAYKEAKALIVGSSAPVAEPVVAK